MALTWGNHDRISKACHGHRTPAGNLGTIAELTAVVVTPALDRSVFIDRAGVKWAGSDTRDIA